MRKRPWTRTTNVSPRVLATLSAVLGFFAFSFDAEALLLNNFISISTSCAPNVDQGVNGQTGPLVNSNSFSCNGFDPIFGPHSGSGTASSSVDYGVMKSFTQATASGLIGDGSATVTLESRDSVTVNPVDASLISHPGKLQASMQLQALQTGGGIWCLAVSTGTPFGPEDICLLPNNSFTSDFDCSTVCTFDFSLPVILGVPTLLDIKLEASSGAGVFFDFSSLDLSQSVYWDGIQDVTFDGQPVAYSLTSTSGHDWTQSSVPGSGSTPVPEPASLALFAIGLGALGFSFRRKVRATQVHARVPNA